MVQDISHALEVYSILLSGIQRSHSEAILRTNTMDFRTGKVTNVQYAAMISLNDHANNIKTNLSSPLRDQLGLTRSTDAQSSSNQLELPSLFSPRTLTCALSQPQTATRASRQKHACNSEMSASTTRQRADSDQRHTSVPIRHSQHANITRPTRYHRVP